MAATALSQERPITKTARVLLIITAMTCALIELIDATVVNVALPELQAGIGVTRTEIAWATTAYSIGNIIIIPLSGMLSDFFGRKNYFTASVVIFTFCSLMCGLSTSLWELILWRCLQGVGGGGLLSTAQSIVIGVFPSEKINTANTIFGIGMIVGPIFGPLIGGFIIQHLTWHWIFFVNLPIGTVAAVLSWLYVSDLEDSVKPKRVDGWGIALLVIGIGTLEFVLEEGGIYDWFSSTSITILFITAILSLTAFVIRELRTDHPALNLRLLRNYNFSMGMLLMFIIGAIMIGSKFFFPLFVRVSLGWTAIQTGQVLSSFAIGAVIGMVVFRKILDKGVSPKIVMLIGLGLMALQLFFLSFSSPNANAAYYIFPLMMGGIGGGALMLPVMSLALMGLRGSELAQGTGMSNMFKRLGSVIGIAVLNVLLDHQTAKVGAAMAAHLTAYNQRVADKLQGLKQTFLSAGYATDQATKAAYQMMGNLLHKQQLLVSYNQGYMIMFIALLSCIPIILFLKRQKKTNP